MAPLSEVHNQARPPRRPAVYGRRRGRDAETRERHRQLFGTDENEIEIATEKMEKLTIDTEKSPAEGTKASCQTQVNPRASTTIQPTPVPESEPVAKSAPKSKVPRRKRKQPARKEAKREMAVSFPRSCLVSRMLTNKTYSPSQNAS
jgi:hypothetical protein